MTDQSQSDRTATSSGPDADEVEQRLGQHAIGLLQAARDAGDPALIAQAEAMAMAVGFALAERAPNSVAVDD
jgi:hypothetical protein